MRAEVTDASAVAGDAPGETLPCLLCGGSEFALLVVGYDRMQARAEDHHYMRCAACGLVRLTPLPAPEQIPALYPQDYFDRIAGVGRNLDKFVNRLAIKYLYGVDRLRAPLLRCVFRALSGRILNGIREPWGANRLLDIGCGSGAELETYRRLGWSVCGIDIDRRVSAACRERGLEVYAGTVFDAPLAGRQFDVVLLSHVIEHVLQPVAVLKRTAALLAPGGRIVVTTPNIRGIGFSLYGSCWYPLEAPRHLFLFDPRTIRRLGMQAGLSVCRVAVQSTPWTLWKSRHYAKTQGGQLPRELTRRQVILQESKDPIAFSKTYRALVAPLTRLAALCGRGDLMQAEFAESIRAAPLQE